MRIFRYLLTFSLSFAFVFAAGCSDPKPDYSEFYKPQPGDEPVTPFSFMTDRAATNRRSRSIPDLRTIS